MSLDRHFVGLALAALLVSSAGAAQAAQPDVLNDQVIGIQGVPVTTTKPTNGQALIYNAQADRYIPGAVAGASGISFTDGTHTVAGATALAVTGGTIGGTAPNATLTVTGSSGLSGMTAGQVPIAHDATTVTSSMALSGASGAAAIVSKTSAAVTDAHLAVWDTNGNLVDGGAVPTSGLSGMTNAQVAIASGADTIGSSQATGTTGTSVILQTDGSGDEKAPVSTTNVTSTGVLTYAEGHGTAYEPTFTTNDYAAAVTDCGKTLKLVNGAPGTVTLPNINPASGECTIKLVQMDTSQYTAQAASGGTVVSPNSWVKTAAQYAVLQAVLITPSSSAAVWDLTGDGATGP